MGGRFLHVVFMPEDGGAVRNFRVSDRVLRGAILCVAGLVLALGASLAFHIRTFQEAQKTESLRSENLALRAQVSEFRRVADELEAGIRTAGVREREARLLAGLDPVDEETRKLGIGGPYMQAEPSGAIQDPGLRAELRDQGTRLDAARREVDFLKSSLGQVLTTLQNNREKFACTPAVCPVQSGYTILSPFGQRTDPFTGRPGFHTGLDLGATPGTPVLATADGKVSFVGYNGDYGLTVHIEHGNGLTTCYCHLATASVRDGESVRRNETVGTVGSSGRTTGPHLHYEVLEHGRPVDPRTYILSLTGIPD